MCSSDSSKGTSTHLPLLFDGWSACNHQHHLIGDGGRWMGIGHLSWVMSNTTVYDMRWYESAIKAFPAVDRFPRNHGGGFILCKWDQSGFEISFRYKASLGGLWRAHFITPPNRRRQISGHHRLTLIILVFVKSHYKSIPGDTCPGNVAESNLTVWLQSEISLFI